MKYDEWLTSASNGEMADLHRESKNDWSTCRRQTAADRSDDFVIATQGKLESLSEAKVSVVVFQTKNKFEKEKNKIK